MTRNPLADQGPQPVAPPGVAAGAPGSNRTIEPDLFERFGLGPLADAPAITAALAERADDASPEERPAIRAAWEALTRRAQVRLELALDALPMPPELGPPPPALGRVVVRPLSLDDLAALPPLTRHLAAPSEAELALDRPRVRP